MGAALARPPREASLLSPEREIVEPVRGPRVRLVALTIGDAPAMLELRLRSGDLLRRREPLRRPDYFTLAGQQEELRDVAAQRAGGRGYAFAIVVDDRMVGRLALSNIIRGAFHNAYLGYWVAAEYGRRGYATEAVTMAVEHAFGPLGLHRVQAAVMVDNEASLRVLEKAGFRREGIAVRYLRIYGDWADHILFAITADEPRPALARQSRTGATPIL